MESPTLFLKKRNMRSVWTCFIRTLFVCLWFCLSLPTGIAAMTPADDADLDGVRAQSGLAIAAADVEIYSEKSYWAYADTTPDGSRIAFEDAAAFYRVAFSEPVFLRVFQNRKDLPIVGVEALANYREKALDIDMAASIDTFTFKDADFGSLYLSGVGPETAAFYATPLGAHDGYPGNSGIGFQAETRSVLDEFEWTYNQEEERFFLGGLQLAGSFDADNIPQGRFSIGDIDARDEHDGALAPASFQVLEDAEGRGFVRMNLPMEGSIRVDDVEMGGHSLGPIMIEDMSVHHLEVDFVPFDNSP